MDKSFDKSFREHLEINDADSEDPVSQKFVERDPDVDFNFRIGIRSIEIFVPDSQSLKQKRYVIKSLKERLKSKFNVSVAETDYQDLWQRSMLVVVTVSNDSKRTEKILAKVNEFVERDPRLIVIETKVSFI